MITTKLKYSPSVNIIRDSKTRLNYLPTPNSKIVFNQIANDFEDGIHCFSLIGAYGTGKSFFLWAFEKSINNSDTFFNSQRNSFKGVNNFEVIRIVGSYDSFMVKFAKEIGLNFTSKSKPIEIISKLEKIYLSGFKKKKGLLILIDELGKFLEFAAKNNPEQELYFIQQLAEYINDDSKNILFLSTLHQDFRSYSLGLSKSQVNEWDKVKGRLKDITFNEPVEQLLYLVSEKTKTLETKNIIDKNFLNLFTTIENSKVFPLKDHLNIDIAKKLLPFDILSASILTLALQKYGQNERSVFSFLELNEPFGIKDFIENKNNYYNLTVVYDYLMYNYSTFLFSKFNPHFSQWSVIKSSIERAENLFDVECEDAIKLIKTVGILNIFTSASGKIDKEFLELYGKVSLEINDPIKLINKLDSNKIIRYSKHKTKYSLFEGTDLDIDLAINEAGELIGQISDVVSYLEQYLELDYLPAKSIFYELGAPRIFQFILSETPINRIAQNEIDGFINLIFSEKLNVEEIKKHSKENSEPIL
ncbi:MAG: hypothetical protein ABI462_11270, partial [Ignavibacteria bacterium]